MHATLRRLALAAALLSASTLPLAANTAIKPEPRDANWVKRHEGFVQLIEVVTLIDLRERGLRDAPERAGKLEAFLLDSQRHVRGKVFSYRERNQQRHLEF